MRGRFAISPWAPGGQASSLAPNTKVQRSFHLFLLHSLPVAIMLAGKEIFHRILLPSSHLVFIALLALLCSYQHPTSQKVIMNLVLIVFLFWVHPLNDPLKKTNLTHQNIGPNLSTVQQKSSTFLGHTFVLLSS